MSKKQGVAPMIEISDEDKEKYGRTTVTAFACGSFEISVRLAQGFAGEERVGHFLRLGRRDMKDKIERLFRDPELVELLRKKNIHMKPIKFSPNVTVTFEEREKR
jgi:2'-5' RNA ligase